MRDFRNDLQPKSCRYLNAVKYKSFWQNGDKQLCVNVPERLFWADVQKLSRQVAIDVSSAHLPPIGWWGTHIRKAHNSCRPPGTFAISEQVTVKQKTSKIYFTISINYNGLFFWRFRTAAYNDKQCSNRSDWILIFASGNTFPLCSCIMYAYTIYIWLEASS